MGACERGDTWAPRQVPSDIKVELAAGDKGARAHTHTHTRACERALAHTHTSCCDVPLCRRRGALWPPSATTSSAMGGRAPQNRGRGARPSSQRDPNTALPTTRCTDVCGIKFVRMTPVCPAAPGRPGSCPWPCRRVAMWSERRTHTNMSVWGPSSTSGVQLHVSAHACHARGVARACACSQRPRRPAARVWCVLRQWHRPRPASCTLVLVLGHIGREWYEPDRRGHVCHACTAVQRSCSQGVQCRQPVRCEVAGPRPGGVARRLVARATMWETTHAVYGVWRATESSLDAYAIVCAARARHAAGRGLPPVDGRGA